MSDTEIEYKIEEEDSCKESKKIISCFIFESGLFLQ